MLSALLHRPNYAWLTRNVLSVMADDPINKPRLMDWLQERIVQKDGKYELRTALHSLANCFQPNRYLEIGVRRGWSLAQVVATCPTVNVIACDLWIPEYGATANPGEVFVREELQRVAPYHQGGIEFLNQDSHNITLNGYFDLITVDGDHSPDGAQADLQKCWPHLAKGGFLVFDDLVGDLKNVWYSEMEAHPELTHIENFDSIVPLGIAQRLI